MSPQEARAAISAERKRQIESEGYDAAHDDVLNDGSLLRAAVIYYQFTVNPPLQIRADGAPLGWPWDPAAWKPRDARRNLERAGALAMAERDRLRRAHAITEPALHKLRLIITALSGLDAPHVGQPAFSH